MNYREEKDKSKKYKEQYLSGINSLIEQRQDEATIIRDEYIKNILKDGDKYREDLKEMFGWPLCEKAENTVPVPKTEKLSDEDGYSVYRMSFEILDGLNMTGLFFKADGDDKKPLVILQHGGLGTPELISGVYGDTANYNDMLSRVLKHNVHIFAPQLLLWARGEDGYGVDFERVEIDARLKRVGSSITAIEAHGIMRILDYFENEPYVGNFGMVGLSYGGFYTLHMQALDTRIKSAVSCSYFNSRDAVPWQDWVWKNSAFMFDDAEIACLVYPRKLYIAIGNKDDLFDYRNGVNSFEQIKKYCKDVGTDWIDFEVFDGTHEFIHSDRQIEKLIEDIK